MSKEKDEKKKKHEPTAAAKLVDPQERVKKLLEETKGDRKKTALRMVAEEYGVTEIEAAFKKVTTKGIGPHTWAKWKAEAEADKKVGEVAGPVLAKEEQAWMSTVLAKFKTLTDRLQAQVINYGTYVLETVAPQVPADTPEEKIHNTLEFLRKAVAMVDPEKVEEIEKFGAAAFLAACTLKTQMAVFMSWADPSSRLQDMAMKCLYSPNPVNKEAFNKLMSELMKAIYQVPRFDRGPSREQIPGFIKAYARARGIPEEAAEARILSLPMLSEVAPSE